MLPATIYRLRFRFSLRALMMALAIVGVGCGWIAMQLRWIGDRHAFAATHPVLTDSYLREVAPGRRMIVVDRRPRAPWPLRWFGEGGFRCIICSGAAIDEDIDRIKLLFPEAEILRMFAHHDGAR